MHTNIDSQDMVNTIIQFCNNNSIIEPVSMDNSEISGQNNNSDNIFDFDNTSSNIPGFDEFDQVLSKYREERDVEHNTNTAIETNSTETFLEISIDVAESSKKAKNFQNTYEEYLKNNSIDRDEANGFKNAKTQSDVISICDDSLEIINSDHNVDLDDISIVSNNIFANLANSDSKSIQIEIDMNKVADSPDVFNNMNYDARNFQKNTNSNYDKDSFENESIQNMNTNDVDNNSECSYHSSDFELITEEEAKMDGLILHFRRNDNIGEQIYESNNENVIEMYLPGSSNETNREHRIPEGEEFYNLFRGVHAPVMTPDIFLENKSVIPTQCMSVDKVTLEFDLRLNKNTVIVGEEHQEEAKVTAKKILETYASNNRRRSRRIL